jgi:uncharacterized phage protein (TIGR01671 family)
MREIKFRVWNHQDKKMVNWEALTNAKDEAVWLWLRQNKEQVHNSLMQYTGLKDKNGVEIYESDLIGIHEYGVCQVFWCERDLAWRILYDDAEIEFLSEFSSGEIEVIGSTHTHPHLF